MVFFYVSPCDPPLGFTQTDTNRRDAKRIYLVSHGGGDTKRIHLVSQGGGATLNGSKGWNKKQKTPAATGQGLNQKKNTCGNGPWLKPKEKNACGNGPSAQVFSAGSALSHDRVVCIFGVAPLLGHRPRIMARPICFCFGFAPLLGHRPCTIARPICLCFGSLSRNG